MAGGTNRLTHRTRGLHYYSHVPFRFTVWLLTARLRLARAAASKRFSAKLPGGALNTQPHG